MKETPATKAIDATAPQTVPEEICALAILKTPLPKKELF